MTNTQVTKTPKRLPKKGKVAERESPDVAEVSEFEDDVTSNNSKDDATFVQNERTPTKRNIKQERASPQKNQLALDILNDFDFDKSQNKGKTKSAEIEELNTKKTRSSKNPVTVETLDDEDFDGDDVKDPDFNLKEVGRRVTKNCRLAYPIYGKRSLLIAQHNRRPNHKKNKKAPLKVVNFGKAHYIYNSATNMIVEEEEGLQKPPSEIKSEAPLEPDSGPSQAKKIKLQNGTNNNHIVLKIVKSPENGRPMVQEQAENNEPELKVPETVDIVDNTISQKPNTPIVQEQVADDEPELQVPEMVHILDNGILEKPNGTEQEEEDDLVSNLEFIPVSLTV